MNYAAGIAKARRLAGLSQGELARRAKVTAGYVSKLESGKSRPSMSVLFDIASVCGVRPARIVEWSQEPKKTPPTAWEAIEAQVSDKATAKKPRREAKS